MLDLLKRRPAKVEALDLVTRERPALPSSQDELTPETPASALGDYAAIAQAIGFAHPHIEADLIVEEFKAFLRRKDWAIFSLPTVIAYMDKKAEAESKAQAGWHWRPLREKDNISEARFGRPAFRQSFRGGVFHSEEAANAAASIPDHVQSASDHYAGPHEAREQEWSGSGHHPVERVVDRPASAAPYDKLVPLHALRKVATIEAEFRKPVAFFVCDYAPAPHIEYADPFLMAVVNNARLVKGVGRFVIDFWDEPGFGLQQQLA